MNHVMSNPKSGVMQPRNEPINPGRSLARGRSGMKLLEKEPRPGPGRERSSKRRSLGQVRSGTHTTREEVWNEPRAGTMRPGKEPKPWSGAHAAGERTWVEPWSGFHATRERALDEPWSETQKAGEESWNELRTGARSQGKSLELAVIRYQCSQGKALTSHRESMRRWEERALVTVRYPYSQGRSFTRSMVRLHAAGNEGAWNELWS